jgi:hypothetical protein
MNIVKAQRELFWLFNAAHAALKISSCHGSIIRASFGFSSPQSDRNLVEDQFIDLCMGKSPIKKLRAIENALSRLSKRERRVIDSLYGGYQFPPQLVSVFQEKTGAALFTSRMSSLKELLTLCRHSLQGSLSSEERSLLLEIRREAEELYREIHERYHWARFPPPCRFPLAFVGREANCGAVGQ